MKDFIEIDFNGLKLPATKILHELLSDGAEINQKSLSDFIELVCSRSYEYENFKNINGAPHEICILLTLYEYCLGIQKKVKDAAINFML